MLRTLKTNPKFEPAREFCNTFKMKAPVPCQVQPNSTFLEGNAILDLCHKILTTDCLASGRIPRGSIAVRGPLLLSGDHGL